MKSPVAPKPNKLFGPPGDNDITPGQPANGVAGGVGPPGIPTLPGNTE